MEQIQTEQQAKQLINIIWAALLMSIFLIIFIGYSHIFPSNLSNLEEESSDFTIQIVLGLVAIAAIRVSMLFNSKAVKALKVDIKKSQVLFIISFAVAEAIAILGLVFGIVSSGDLVNYGYLFFAAGVYVHLRNKPNFS